MDSFYGGFTIERVFSLMLTAAWIFIDLGLAAVVLYRFRATVAGILMGGALALMSAKNFLGTLLWEVWLRPAMHRSWDYDYGGVSSLITPELFFFLKSLVSFGLMFVLIIGILTIPISLKKLELKAAGQG